jgi:hypothetical protein
MSEISLDNLDKLHDLSTALFVTSYAANTDIDKGYISSMLTDLTIQLDSILSNIGKK